MALIYALIDPRTSEIRYIGQTKYRQKRYKQHIQNCAKDNPAKHAWIAELKEMGLLPECVFLEEDVDWEQRYEREAHWIRHYLNMGAPLTNISSNDVAKDKRSKLAQARCLIRDWSKPTRANHYNKGWGGVAPSYLCSELEISYSVAATILKDLEDEGFIYDNGNGNHFTLPDGRTYATRYYMTGTR